MIRRNCHECEKCWDSCSDSQDQSRCAEYRCKRDCGAAWRKSNTPTQCRSKKRDACQIECVTQTHCSREVEALRQVRGGKCTADSLSCKIARDNANNCPATTIAPATGRHARTCARTDTNVVEITSPSNVRPRNKFAFFTTLIRLASKCLAFEPKNACLLPVF